MRKTEVDINDREFVSLMASNQRKIFSYILTLVPSFNDAEDIMQDTAALMWEKKADFTAGTDFAAWGMRIAYYKVIEFRRNMSKSYRLMIDVGRFKNVDEEAVEKSKHIDMMISKLEKCIQKLSSPDRRLIYLRYIRDLHVKEISSRLNKSIRSLYLGISRIQTVLLECVRRNQI